ncbi:phosphopantetheine-binding protein [Kitasatospora sp. NPDC056138]|uniref:phosphopantetheine-binding protein n=1 Tax=Kitasatospora sp. NPDC056138 TaxID=3345724 RepID=UPI0035D8B6C3
MIGDFISSAKGRHAAVEFSDESHLIDDLEFDSLDLVSFLAEIEDAWGFAISDEDFSVDRFATVGSVRSYIRERVVPQEDQGPASQR